MESVLFLLVMSYLADSIGPCPPPGTVECHLSDHFGTGPMFDNRICRITDTIFM